MFKRLLADSYHALSLVQLVPSPEAQSAGKAVQRGFKTCKDG
jgi:hypothetical protein